ncbi:MAG: apolipoprotein N-acyltransferase [Candidatus Poribacteria bacterium]|nr:apolipoprotein N-acyltransferase [Candidatus Poribacteria bacterium]
MKKKSPKVPKKRETVKQKESIKSPIRRYQSWILAGISGILLILSFPSFNLFPIAWMGLIPLLIALKSVSSSKSAFWHGYVAGAIFFFGLLYWIILLYPFANIFLTTFGCVALVAYLAAYVGVFSVLLHRLPWRSGLPFIFIAPTIWTGLEWVRSWLLTGFPWGSMGYTQWNNLPAIQIASLTGVHGVSFVVVLFNATIAEALRTYPDWKRSRHQASPLRFVMIDKRAATIIPIAIVIACFIYGLISLSRPVETTSETQMALVPGNIQQLDKWNRENLPAIFKQYIDLIEKADAAQPDLIVLPETAIPGAIFSGGPNDYRRKLEQMLHDRQIYLLTGVPHFTPELKIYNRVFLLSPSGDQLGSYSKTHLVPFGEYVPISRHLPNLIQLPSGYEAGKSIDLFPVPSVEGAQMGIVICFESIFPNLFRKFVLKGANVMGILTNDAWYEGTAAPEQHFAIAPLRAIENRVAVFRCANGGISCIIDPFGRVTKERIQPNDTQGFLIGDVPLIDQKKTVYTRYGDWFPILCFLVSVILVLYHHLSNRRVEESK